MKNNELKLIEPTEALGDNFLSMLAEYRKAGERKVHGAGSMGLAGPENVAQLIQQARDHARGRNLPKGYVPRSTYWLACGERILGICGLRHRLTDRLREHSGHLSYSVRPSERNKGYGTLMLKLALEKARERGLDRVLITCDKTNIASARVIQKNGGVLDSESYSDRAGRVAQRYWIDL